MRHWLVFPAFLLGACAHASVSESGFPTHFDFHGSVQDRQGSALEGVKPVSIRLLSADETSVLGSELDPKIIFDEGRFSLTIGDSESLDVQAISAAHPELLMELTIDGQLQGPLIRIQPAGHSTQSRLTLAGVANKDGSLHSKGYAIRSNSTAIQAVHLTPVQTAAPIEQMRGTRTNPMLVPVLGPVISQPLSSLPSMPNVQGPFIDREVNPPRHEDLFDRDGRRYGTANPADVDDALATDSLSGPSLMTPAPGLNFEGVANVNGVLPPDIEGTVGPEHYIHVVNLAFAVFDKSGNLLAGPSNTNTLWAGFGGACQTDNSGDAIFMYDQQADRYVLTQFAVGSATSVCFAVSTSNDPLGTYYLYELAAARFPDYYKLGVWSDPDNNAYYMSTNSGFAGGYDVYAIDRENLLAGQVPRQAQLFQSFANLMMPADQDGSTPPPAGSPGLFYTVIAGGETYFSNPPPANDSIDLYEYDVDWGNAANSTYTLVNSFSPPEITDFIWTICGFFESDCLPQPTTTVNLDSGSWWPMQRFQYRNFGSHETLVGTWTVEVLAAGDQAAPRWFELRRDANARGAGWSVFQEGTYVPDTANRWEPSISMNGQGDIGMVYSVVDADNNVFPGIRFAGRQADDPLGTLRTESSLIEGTGVQTSSSNRWGDYASMDVDPSDDCRFWFTSEYVQTTGGANWQTRIGTFSFPGCVSVVTSNSAQAVCAADDAVSYPLSLAGEFDGTTDLSVSSCPTGASCDFSVNPVVNPATDSALQISGLSGSTPSGDYTIGVTATDSVDANKTFSTSVFLNVVNDVPAVTQLSMPIDTATLISTQSRQFSWTETADAGSYVFELSSDAGFGTIIETATVSGNSYTSSLELDPETSYYWRVSAGNLCGLGIESPTFSFTTAPLPGDCQAGAFPMAVSNFDFEVDAQGWTSASLVGANAWTLSTNNPDQGAQHWHIDDIDTESDTTLTSPPIVLPTGMSPLTLQFNNYQNMESNTATSCWDGGVLEISTDAGASFTQLQNEVLLTDPYTGPFQSNSILFGENGWCGDPQPYLNSIVDIDAFAGQTVQFRFRVVTDGAVGDEGWDIDDVRIQSCELDLGQIFSDGFEN